MDFHRLIHEIDSEISRLQQARALLTGEPTKRGPGRPKTTATHKVATTASSKPAPAAATRPTAGPSGARRGRYAAR